MISRRSFARRSTGTSPGGDELATLVATIGASRRTIIIGATEHKSVIGPARALTRRAMRIRVAPLDADGSIDLCALERLIADDTLLASIGAVNNEIGTVQCLTIIWSLCREVGALFTLHGRTLV